MPALITRFQRRLADSVGAANIAHQARTVPMLLELFAGRVGAVRFHGEHFHRRRRRFGLLVEEIPFRRIPGPLTATGEEQNQGKSQESGAWSSLDRGRGGLHHGTTWPS